MPYSQIIALMVALLLITGVNGDIEPLMSLGIAGFFWTLKVIVWALFVFWITKKKAARPTPFLLERLQWVSLILLATDIYVLDLKTYLTQFITLPLPGLIEISTLSIYILYLIITWTAYWSGLKKAGGMGTELPLSDEIGMRLRLILPAIIPYLIITLASDFLHLVKWPWLNNFMESGTGEALSLAFILITVVILIPPMIRVIWRCKPLSNGHVRDLIEEFLRRYGVKYKEILLWPLGGPRFCTAAVLGVIPRFRYILLTPCLMQYLIPEEIDAVLAHEAAHIRKKHMLWYIIFIGVFSLTIYRLSDPFWVWILSHGSFIKALLSLGDISKTFVSLAISLPIGLLLILYFRFLMGYFMRNFEREADLSIFDAHGHPWHLINTLEKVALLAGNIRTQPSWHHFSIAERVNFLRQIAQNPHLRSIFSKKLNQKKTAFLLTAAFLSLLPSLLPINSWKAVAKQNMVQIYLERGLKYKGHTGPHLEQ